MPSKKILNYYLQNNMENSTNEKKYNGLIIAVSIVIPVVVALLFSFKLKDFGFDVKPLIFHILV